MGWNLHGTEAAAGDLIELVGLGFKHFTFELKENGEYQTHRGVIKHNDIIGKPWGSQVFSHLGNPFYILQPALGDLLKDTPRNTQILYPKEIGFILLNMGIGPGQVVLEAGTGSGAFTTSLAFAVGTQGHIYSYEARPEMQAIAVSNLTRLGLADRVTFKIRNIVDGFDEQGVDGLFLDVPNPYDYILQARKALKPGGFFGSILPTTNQITKLLVELRRNDFAFIEVLEILLRYYKAEPERFRPTDRMVAHTGYLIFARPVIIDHSAENMDNTLISEIITTDK